MSEMRLPEAVTLPPLTARATFVAGRLVGEDLEFVDARLDQPEGRMKIGVVDREANELRFERGERLIVEGWVRHLERRGPAGPAARIGREFGQVRRAGLERRGLALRRASDSRGPQTRGRRIPRRRRRPASRSSRASVIGSNLWSWQRAQPTLRPRNVWPMLITISSSRVLARQPLRDVVRADLAGEQHRGRDQKAGRRVLAQRVADELLADELVVRRSRR